MWTFGKYEVRLWVNSSFESSFSLDEEGSQDLAIFYVVWRAHGGQGSLPMVS